LRKNRLQATRLAFALLLAWPGLAAAAGIVAGDRTSTTVATGPNGHQVVSIALPVSGVSHNAYRQFDVSRAGADLNNAGVSARLIVNEVEGSAPSRIEGPLAVLGPRASLVIANPNGITVNGGRFVNTGNVALTTGQVSFLDFPIAPDESQRNVVLDTSRGKIEIGPEGLSGAMISLELIAADIRVHGPLVNENAGEGGRLRMVAGASRAEINSAVSPTDNLTPWISYAGGDARPGATAIDITPLGSLQAGRIEIIVTDQGAGVRHAGTAYASGDAFTLLASGELKADGGSIRSAGDLVIDSAAIHVSASERGVSDWRSDRHMDLRSADISLADAALLGGGNIGMGMPGGSASGISILRSQVDAGAGLSILGGATPVMLDASTLHAAGTLELRGGALTAQRSTVSSGLEMLLDVSGAAAIEASVLNGGGDVTVRAGSLALRPGSTADGSLARSGLSSSGDLRVQTAGTVLLSGADLLADGNVRIAPSAFSQESQSQVYARRALLMEAQGDLVNAGGVLMGGKADPGDPALNAAVTLHAGGNFLNASPSASAPSLVYGSDGDVLVQAGGELRNRHARIIAGGRLDLRATGDVINEISKEGGLAEGVEAAVRRDYESSDRRWLVLRKRRAGFDIDYGAVVMPEQPAYLAAETGMTIRGADIRSLGGEIIVNSGSLDMQADSRILLQAVFSGSAHYERNCLIVCGSEGSSTVQTQGGLLSAAGNVSLKAGDEIQNIGGRVLALGDLEIAAPRVVARGVMGYSAISRERGLKSWFGDSWAQIYASDIGDSYSAAGGRLRLSGRLYVDGGSAEGARTTEISDGTEVIRPPRRDPVMLTNHLGLTSWLWQ
jgi:filamentous hemagglutinin family protein